MEKITVKAFVKRCNQVCTQALEAAAGMCVSNGQFEISIDHFLLKLMEYETDLAQILDHYDVCMVSFVKALQHAVDDGARGNSGKPVFSRQLVGLLEDAWLVSSLELQVQQIRSGAIVLAILANMRRHGMSDYAEQLSSISYDDLIANFSNIVAQSKESEAIAMGNEPGFPQGVINAGTQENLGKFCINFTQQARNGDIDPVFCRDSEIRQMIDVLARRRKNNPICVGEAGVGKTSIVEGLALKIIEGDVPDILADVEIYGLDLTLLQAGASVKGEFEKRLNAVIEEVKSSVKPVILFIDEAHTLIGAGGSAGTGDAANLLKPALARGELRTIAATTWSEYKKYFEKDPALSRRFQLIKLEEPTPEQATIIIRGLRDTYEKAHGVYVRDDAVVSAVEMSDRYINGRQLPDKAIDVIDTAAARVKVSLKSKPETLIRIENDIQTLEREYDAIKRDMDVDIVSEQGRLDELSECIAEKRTAGEKLTQAWLREAVLASKILQLRKDRAEIQLSHELKIESETPHSNDALEENAQEIHYLVAELAELQGDNPLVHFEVCPAVVNEVISSWTGIPVGKMVKDEASNILTFASRLKERIKGQEYAVEAVDKGIRAAKAGINNPDAPMGVFLFVGPSGVGKTETCISVADLLFGGEQYLTSVNMSEFQEKHSVSRLIGSPPGYVGYGEGGILTEAVRQKPYSVVLLDEVEKADLEVMNLFYQVFDKGVLSDGEGQLVNFKNTIVFLTSNLATDIITDMCVNADQYPTPEEISDKIRPILSKHFKPALLARMQIVPFVPISESVLADITRLKLHKLKDRLHSSHQLKLEYPDGVVDAIVSRCKEVETGARNIDHIINGNLLPKLASEILTHLEDGNIYTKVTLSMDDSGDFQTEFA